MIGTATVGKIRQHLFDVPPSQIRTQWTMGLSVTKAALFNVYNTWLFTYSLMLLLTLMAYIRVSKVVLRLAFIKDTRFQFIIINHTK